MSKLTSRRPRTYTRCCFKPSEITPPTIGFWHFLRTPISRVSKQKRIRTLNTNNFSSQPSMASHPTSADSTAPWDPSSPFVTTYGLPTGLSCMAHAWWFLHDSGKRSSTSCTPPIKAKTALYAGPDKWSTGHLSQMIFAMWSVAARRAQNAFPPMPLEPLLVEPPPSRPFECAASDLFELAGHHFLVYTDRFSGWPTVGTCGRTATSAQVISLLKEWMSEKRHSSTADNGWRSPVYLAGIQRVLCQLGNLSHNQQSLTITRPTEPPRQQSRPLKPFSERRLGMGT